MVPSLLWKVLIPSHMVFTSPNDFAAVPVEMLYSWWTSDQKQTVWEITYDVVTWVGNEYYLVQLTTLIAVYRLGDWNMRLSYANNPWPSHRLLTKSWPMNVLHDPALLSMSQRQGVRLLTAARPCHLLNVCEGGHC